MKYSTHEVKAHCLFLLDMQVCYCLGNCKHSCSYACTMMHLNTMLWELGYAGLCIHDVRKHPCSHARPRSLQFFRTCSNLLPPLNCMKLPSVPHVTSKVGMWTGHPCAFCQTFMHRLEQPRVCAAYQSSLPPDGGFIKRRPLIRNIPFPTNKQVQQQRLPTMAGEMRKLTVSCHLDWQKSCWEAHFSSNATRSPSRGAAMASSTTSMGLCSTWKRWRARKSTC